MKTVSALSAGEAVRFINDVMGDYPLANSTFLHLCSVHGVRYTQFVILLVHLVYELVSKRFSIRNKVADYCSGYTVFIDNGETYAVLWIKDFLRLDIEKQFISIAKS
jgi:hypothetical protein